MILDKLKKLRKPTKTQGLPTQEANCRLLESTLRSLNCAVEWRDEADTKVCSYTFQDGCFLVDVPKSQPQVRLCFPTFFSDSLEYLDLVRQVCNHINVQSPGTRLVYTLDADHYQADVHALDNLVLHPDHAKEVLTKAMQGIFACRNQFYTDFECAQAERKRTGITTPELDKAEEQRLQSMLCEHEVDFGSASIPLRESSTRPITLAAFATEALQVEGIIPSRLDILGDGISQTLDASEDHTLRKQLSDFVLSSALVADGAFVRRYATLRLVFFTAAQPFERRYLTLTLVAGEATKEALYFQVSAILPPLLPGVARGSRSERGETKSCTVLMAYDLKEEKQLMDEFLYLWNDAKDKLSNSEADQLSDTQRLVVNLTDASLAMNIYQGRQLFLSHRFLDALPRLANAFTLWRGAYETMGAADRRLFGSLCFMLGYSYDALGQYRQGYYYLSLIDMEEDYDYVREMVSCLVSMDDPRAAGYIESCLQFVRKSVGNDTGDDVDEYAAADHPAFHALTCGLLVARLRLLIRHHHFEKAEEELGRMNAIAGLKKQVSALRSILSREKGVEEWLRKHSTQTKPST